MTSIATAMSSVHTEVARARRDARGLTVETSNGPFDARVAASCLLHPDDGDEVLVAIPPRGSVYVLAVLERDETRPARLRVEASSGLDLASAGAVAVRGESVDVTARRELHLASEQLGVHANQGTVVVDRLMASGRELLAQVGAVKGVLDSLDTTVQRVHERIGRAVRLVEETDLTRAGDIDQRAEGSLVMRAKDAMVTARRLFRVDGEQIHLG